MAVDRRSSRLASLGVIALVLFGALGMRMWFLQVVDSPVLEQRVQANKTRTVKLLPERGRIFDRKGRIMADNERILTITVAWEAMGNKDSVVDTENRLELFGRLSKILDMSVSDMEQRFTSNKYGPLLPMPLAEGVSEETAAYLIERNEDFPGIDFVTQWKREYPLAPLAAHVVGYLGAITQNDVAQYLDVGYDLNERVGQFGVEKIYERYLRGKPGYVKYEIDSRGTILRVLERVEPIAGNDLQLAIDLDYQQFAEQALETQLLVRRFVETCQAKDSKRQVIKPQFSECENLKSPAGSVVMMDYSTGEVLALASYPTFDNRWFNSGISSDKFREIFPKTDDPDKSLLVNRAIQGQYNLGSSFKPFVAYAALDSGQLVGGSEYKYSDRGSYQLTSINEETCLVVKCIYRNALCSGGNYACQYGDVTVEDALAVSSDTFFYKIGEEIFAERGGQPVLQDEVKKFGFGSRTGIDLPFETAGRVPDKASKKKLVEDGALMAGESSDYLVGDNVQLAVGQGLLAASPLQLAQAYGALANGGDVNRPLVGLALLKPSTPNSEKVGYADMTQAVVETFLANKDTIRSMNIPDEIRDPIVRGLTRVITGPGVTFGSYHSTTGERLFRSYPYDALPIAGKTGTAQGRAGLPWNDSSAFGAFSLDPSRPIVVTAYLEKSGYGAKAAAPVVKCLFMAIAGVAKMNEVLPSNPLDITATVAAPQRLLPNKSCLGGGAYGGRD
ncbi:MAG: penicillin-binding transpeptidase domain-containing protein [Actinomycetes bacterium]